MNKDVQKIYEAYGNIKYKAIFESNNEPAMDGDVFVLPNGKKVVYYAEEQEADDDRYNMHILVDQETNKTFAYLKNGNGVESRGPALKSAIQDRLDNSEVSMNSLNTPVIWSKSVDDVFVAESPENKELWYTNSMQLSKQIEKVLNNHNFYRDKLEDFGIDSHSGRGSSMYTTEDIRKHLPLILKTFNIKSIIDSPCGDWNWIKEIDLNGVDYLGYDVVEEILNNNEQNYGSKKVLFQRKDLLNEDFNTGVDLIICRDFLFHISNADVLLLLEKFKTSGSKYLLSTSFDDTTINSDIGPNDDGYGFRKINLLIEPFNMLTPTYSFIEAHPHNEGRSMHLWKLNNSESL